MTDDHLPDVQGSGGYAREAMPVMVAGAEYETVAASSTDQVLGDEGGEGDILATLIVTPASTSPGAVQVKDGDGSAITLFAGGDSSVTSLIPFVIYLGLRSLNGPWQITTGADVSVVATGEFS